MGQGVEELQFTHTNILIALEHKEGVVTDFSFISDAFQVLSSH